MKDILELNRLIKIGYHDLDDTLKLLENSNDDRISFLLEKSDIKIKFEMIYLILNFDEHRKRKLLRPYSEFVKFIREINKVGTISSVQEELYKMALEQIKTKYIPVGLNY